MVYRDLGGKSPMRRLAIVAACLLGLAACAEKPEKVAEAPPKAPDLTRSDCYTVELFDELDSKQPGSDVPADYAAFYGEWRNGAWDGKWCHDLIIFEVAADGAVQLMDMHAPYEPWNQPASAFRRSGRITEDGELRFAHGQTQRSYRIVNGRLMAKRTSGLAGEYVAQLKRPWDVPLPVPRPATLGAATAGAPASATAG